jgi:tetratricopeptide (TPR) repeat protein
LALALEAWERAAEINPDETILLVARGLIHEKLGQVQLAESEYARARTRGAATDTFSQFLQLVTSSIEHAGSQSLVPPLFLLLQCTSHQVHGQNEQALERCDRALESDPAYLNALWKRGQLHAAQGDWESALADYTAAIQVDPSWPWVYYLRALALAELGQTDEAQADLARALELDPVGELRQQIESLVLDK